MFFEKILVENPIFHVEEVTTKLVLCKYYQSVDILLHIYQICNNSMVLQNPWFPHLSYCILQVQSELWRPLKINFQGITLVFQ